MEPYDTLDAFIAEHGFGLYMIFLGLSMVTIGLILARHTLVTHRVVPTGFHPSPRTRPGRRQPPVLPPIERRRIGMRKTSQPPFSL